ncbi:hypothetical protein [Bowmanella dokdonensis]|uniref:Uncharacterized protein n=1 Tax=Bowmanella dokdonensis TaxID=751969 RepID=A0A939DL39_9ALTE|nr:hypothetical protein [Bowmanella dokdonensis]MBN7824703.1 hypothetical protein [Bowmanella dokdonensis]
MPVNDLRLPLTCPASLARLVQQLLSFLLQRESRARMTGPDGIFSAFKRAERVTESG